LFEGGDDFDVSAFTPKTADKTPKTPPEDIRAVSEAAQFRSREPGPAAPPKAVKTIQRRRRTGRNQQLNVKLAANTVKLFYEITDKQGWVLGETLERALAALQRELDQQK
jgi:hypothetical protein